MDWKSVSAHRYKGELSIWVLPLLSHIRWPFKARIRRTHIRLFASAGVSPLAERLLHSHRLVSKRCTLLNLLLQVDRLEAKAVLLANCS